MLLDDLKYHSAMFNRNLEDVGNGQGLDIQRGEKIENWIAERDMICQNDGSPTRIDKRTGRETTSDITCGHSLMSERFEWRTEYEFSSDHKPIIVSMANSYNQIIRTNEKLVYKYEISKANWSEYTMEIEDNIPDHCQQKRV